MKIAIDSGPLTGGHGVRGIGFYTKNLVRELGKEVDVVDFAQADLNKYDVIHVPFFNPFFINIPIGVRPKIVLTIHDLTPLVYPKHYPPGLRGSIKFLINKMLLRRVSIVITDTEASKKDIVRFLDIPAAKIRPIHLAPGKEFKKLEIGSWKLEIKKRYSLPDRFVLYLGDVNYNKNIPGLIEACRIADLPLVVVGKQAVEIDGQNLDHPELSHLKGLDWGNVLRLGYVPDEDLVAIFNLATLYCQASFYEGFGLPVLQAMACGVPVVAAKTQALVEIGEGSCLLADPKDPKDLANKIKQVINNSTLGQQLVNTGLVAVKKFSWTKTAHETLEVYRHV